MSWADLDLMQKRKWKKKCNINSHVDFWCDLLERI